MNINFDGIYTRYAKYRIQVGKSTTCPYLVQTKASGFFTSWITIMPATGIEKAEEALFQYIAKKVPPPGTIVRKYNECGVLVSTLNSTI